MYTHQFGSAVNEYYVDEMRNIAATRSAKIRNLKTKADAENYVMEVREKVLASFALPEIKSPLKPQITGKIEHDTYTVENVIYQSRENFPVTANLYKPLNCKNAPAMLFLCGHALEGKFSDVYRTVMLNLVRNGYVVLGVDPINQGERAQFNNIPEDIKRYGLCGEHNIMGRQMQLIGENFATWRAYDALRGIDYLKTLPEVDSAHIMVTGNSGGGTLSTSVNALSDDLFGAAPSCYITSFLHNIENELPVDAEQVPAFLAGMGCEMADLLIARAPRPLLIMGQKKDFFDARGTAETYEEVRHIYELLGAGDNVSLFIGPTSHGYSIHNREAMYNFFNKFVKADAAEYHEPETLSMDSAEALSAAPNGQVDQLPGMRLVRDIIQSEATAMIQNRPKRSLEELRELFAPMVEPERVEAPPHYRILRGEYIAKDQLFSRFGIESEPDRVMSVLKIFSKKECISYLPEGKEARLYVSHLDSRDEAAGVLGDSERLFMLDVRGIGECIPDGTDQAAFGGERDFFQQYQFDYHYASLGVLLADSYLGGKVRDILSSLALLQARFETVILEARGQACIPAALAAVYAKKPVQLKLYDRWESWQEVTQKPMFRLPQSAMWPNALAISDLDEMLSLLK